MRQALIDKSSAFCRFSARIEQERQNIKISSRSFSRCRISLPLMVTVLEWSIPL